MKDWMGNIERRGILILLLLSMVLLVVGLWHIGIWYYKKQETLSRYLNTQPAVLLASVLNGYSDLNGTDQIQPFVAQLKFPEPGIDLWVTDGDGNVIASNRDHSEVTDPFEPSVVNQTPNAYQLNLETGHQLHVHTGALDSYTTLRRDRYIGITFVVISLVLTSIVIVVIRRQLFRRVEVLSEHVTQAMERPPRSSQELRGNDAVCQLSRDLNKLIKTLYLSNAELADSRQRFELAVSGSNDIIWDWDIEGNSLYLSPKFESILQTGKDNVPGLFLAFKKLIHVADQKIFDSALAAHIEHGELFAVEFRMRRGDGDWRWLLGRGQVVRGKNASPLRMVGSLTDVTKRKLDHIHLEETLNRLASLVESIPGIVIFKDEKGLWNVVNSLALNMLRIERDDWIGKTDIEIAQTNPQIREFLEESYEVDQQAWAARRRIDTVNALQLGNSGLVYLEMSRIPLFDENGERKSMLVIGHDVTEKTRAQHELELERQKAQITLGSIADGVITTNIHGQVEYLNDIAEDLTGWNNDEAMGKPIEQIFRLFDSDTHVYVDVVESVLLNKEVYERAGLYLLNRRTRLDEYVDISAAPIIMGKSCIGTVLVFHDISERKQLMERLTYQASHDALTTLMNRYSFEVRLQSALDKVKDNSSKVLLAYIDLDQFKVINDTCGHTAGDQLLRGLTEAMLPQIHENDVLARIGGDEFCLLLEDTQCDKALERVHDLHRVIRNYRFVYKDKPYTVGASIGVVEVAEHTLSGIAALSAADEACYIAKERGRNRVSFIKPDDTQLTRIRGEMQWASELHKGFDEQRFKLCAQPIVPVTAGNAGHSRHLEILLRYENEHGELVSPGAFLPVAERYGMVSDIDRWVIARVMEQAAKEHFESECCDIALLSINISGGSLADDDFLSYVMDLFKQYDMRADKFCFEITETVAISNYTHALRFITRLKSIGCKFSLDDFGSGFSSFTYLKTLPVDFLKIDGSLIRHIATEEKDAAMVKAINEIAHITNLQTVAEFVENEEIFDALTRLGVDYAQGHLFGEPKLLEYFCRAGAN